MRTKNSVVAFLALGTLAGTALAQTVSYTGGTYVQNFDGLAPAPSTTTTLTGRGPHHLQGVAGSTGVFGWYGANFAGTSTNTEFRAQDGSLAGSAGRGVVSFGTAGSAERALGALPTSNQISTIGAVFTNNTAGVLDSVTISFTGEQWRRGDVATPNTLSFAYALNSSIQNANLPFAALNFVSPNTQAAPTEVALNGNLPANQTFVSATISGLTWAPGTDLAIAWTINDITGQDDGLAIDSFSLVAVPTLASIALLGMGAVVAGRRRRN